MRKLGSAFIGPRGFGTAHSRARRLLLHELSKTHIKLLPKSSLAGPGVEMWTQRGSRVVGLQVLQLPKSPTPVQTVRSHLCSQLSLPKPFIAQAQPSTLPTAQATPTRDLPGHPNTVHYWPERVTLEVKVFAQPYLPPRSAKHRVSQCQLWLAVTYFEPEQDYQLHFTGVTDPATVPALSNPC